MWVYLHLPAKWLGGRKPLGWGAGPYGDGAGWPEPIYMLRKRRRVLKDQWGKKTRNYRITTNNYLSYDPIFLILYHRKPILIQRWRKFVLLKWRTVRCKTIGSRSF